jgi:hydroxylamine reductase
MWCAEKTHTDRYGHPVPTPVPTVPVPGPCVLVSGHDMHDIETLLQQCDKDAAANPNAPRVNVYTHGEMLPAHSYPNLKKYKSLAGH